MAQLRMPTGAAPSTPSTGKVAFYFKSDKLAYILNDAGAEYQLALLNQNTSGTAAGLSATLVPASGGTGVANNNASTWTISGNYATTHVVPGAYSYTYPGATCTLLATNGSAASLTSFPTLNQNTSGTAAGLSATDLSEYCGTAGGTADVITLTPTPAIASYAAAVGAKFLFKSAGTNTVSPPTINISGKGALNTTMGSVALPVGGIISGQYYWALLESAASIRVSPYDTLSSNGDTVNGTLTWTSGGVAGATINGNTFTTGTGTLTLAAGKTVSFADAFTTSGAYAVTLTFTGATGVTFPTTGTLASLAVAQTYTAAQRGAMTALTDASTVAVDLSLDNNFVVQLGGNRTLGVPTGVAKNQQGTISVLQDKTGSRTLAYAWPYVWAGGSAGTLSTAGGTEDQLVYEVWSYNAGTVTMTLATPGVVTFNSHGFYHGQRVQLTTTGGLPTGLSANTTYFVEVIDANSFYLCTSLANVAAGTRIATSVSQSGVHTLTGMTIRLALNKGYA